MATDLSDEECARLQEIFKKRAEELKIEREEKARNFEAFINEKLKVDLRKTLLERDKIYEQISEYLEVRNTVILMKESEDKSAKTLINLGNEFFAQATIPDTSRICVDVGLGFLVEYTLDEALDVIKLREDNLNDKANILTERASSIRARIKIMLHGLSELLNLNPSGFDGL